MWIRARIVPDKFSHHEASLVLCCTAALTEEMCEWVEAGGMLRRTISGLWPSQEAWKS